jgi:DNA-binding transcriptional LysR family regulator
MRPFVWDRVLTWATSAQSCSRRDTAFAQVRPTSRVKGRHRCRANWPGRKCVVFDLPGYRERWLFRDKSGRLIDVPITSDLRISSALAIRQCALDGLGPTLIGQWNIDSDLADGRLIDLFPEYSVTATDFDTAAWIIYPSRSYLPAKVRAFIDFVRERLRHYGLNQDM